MTWCPCCLRGVLRCYRAHRAETIVSTVGRRCGREVRWRCVVALVLGTVQPPGVDRPSWSAGSHLSGAKNIVAEWWWFMAVRLIAVFFNRLSGQ